jgi:peptidoglycan/LPS O-acetylase OafA/YrhL
MGEDIMNHFFELQFPTWIIWIVLVALLCFRLKVCKFKEWQDSPWSLGVSKGILGFFAILIILHHLAQTLAGDEAVRTFTFLENWGVCFVGGFFFFSGYGLMKSFMTKQDYLKGFFRKRFLKILIPFYVCILVFIFCSIALLESYGWIDAISYITGWRLINTHMWYIIDISVLYAMFYFLFRFIKNLNIALAAMGILIAGITVTSLFLGHGDAWFQGEWWYNTLFVFFIGVLFAKTQRKILPFIKRTYPILLLFSIGAFIALYQSTIYMLTTYSYWSEFENPPGYVDKFRCLSSQLPMVIVFVFILLLLLMKVRFANKILSFLGNISLELYLIHNLFIMMLRDSRVIFIKSTSMYMLMVLIGSITLAYVLHRVNQYVIHLFSHEKRVEEPEDRIHSIDFMRFFACFLVICIHIPFEGYMGAVWIAFGKIAVPFFLVVCGYFLYREDDVEFKKRLLKQIKNIFILTVVSHLGYLVINYIFVSKGNLNVFFASNFNKKSIIDFFLYNMSPAADHLWYLGSLLYALILILILCKAKWLNYVMYVAPILLSLYIYLSWTGDAPYYVYRNALFVTTPYVLMGCIMKRHEKVLLKCSGKFLIGLTFVLFITNLLELQQYQTTGVPFFSAEFLVYIIVLLCMKYPTIGAGTVLEKIGKRYSLSIYILHISFLIMMADIPLVMIYFGPIILFLYTLLLAIVIQNAAKFFLKKLETVPKKIGVV